MCKYVNKHTVEIYLSHFYCLSCLFFSIKCLFMYSWVVANKNHIKMNMKCLSVFSQTLHGFDRWINDHYAYATLHSFRLKLLPAAQHHRPREKLRTAHKYHVRSQTRNMRRLICICFCLTGNLQFSLVLGLEDTPTFGSPNLPRLLSKGNLTTLPPIWLRNKMILAQYMHFQCLKIWRYLPNGKSNW